MKRIVVVINPENQNKLENIFENNNVGGVIISNVQGFGNQKGYTEKYRGSIMSTRYLNKIQMETVVGDEMVDSIVEDILDDLQSGEIGDGKIFIYDAFDVVRIRTGEHGDIAL